MSREEILAAAKKCVCGDRDQQYGTPENSFGVIAEFWVAYLKATNPGAEINIDGADVAALMALFKIARIATGTQKADSWIDAAGYIACGGEIAEGAE